MERLWRCARLGHSAVAPLAPVGFVMVLATCGEFYSYPAGGKWLMFRELPRDVRAKLAPRLPMGDGPVKAPP